jgi:hypothetical protein
MEKCEFQFFQITKWDLKQIIKEAVASELQNFNLNKPHSDTSTEDDLLTREEAKKLLKTSYTSLWKYDREGLLPARRIAGRVYYLKSDLFNVLNSVA